MMELSENMQELDKQSEELFNKLGTLEEDLKRETSEFEVHFILYIII
jgi:hypothetical protein